MRTDAPFCVTDSPVGRLYLGEEDGCLAALYPVDAPLRPPETPLLTEALRQLTAYFDGALTAFDLPLKTHGTAFQERCWAALREIPCGATVTYGEQARRVGHPRASRAVGGANHRNPIMIVIPCHRVVGADGSLTGYGGGLPMKAWLLEHERAMPERTAPWTTTM